MFGRAAFCYGVYQVAREECERCVLDALSVGYRHIDTAQAYQNEEQVGSAVEKSGVPRGEIFITSKVWVDRYDYDECRKSVSESLEKLRTDYIDLSRLKCSRKSESDLHRLVRPRDRRPIHRPLRGDSAALCGEGVRGFISSSVV